jgi:sugar/nucleoside kinase (ribokinase family)
VVHNLGVRTAGHGDYIEAMLAHSSILVGNRVEVDVLTEQTGLDPPGLLGRPTSVEQILVTGGREGVLLYQTAHREPARFAAPRVEDVVSPVGAGDTFAAALIAAIFAGRDVRDAIDLAMRVAALAVQSADSFPDLQAVSTLAIELS